MYELYTFEEFKNRLINLINLTILFPRYHFRCRIKNVIINAEGRVTGVNVDIRRGILEGEDTINI